jgi:predicted DNA-binding transcriptional regulator AlpA
MLNVLDTPGAAAFCGMATRTFEKWRLTGQGPPYRKLGTRVVYLVDELIEWMDACKRFSTSDPAHPSGGER